MELGDYVRILRTRKRLIVLSVIVMTAAAVVLTAAQKPAYQGVAQVLITTQNTGITMLGTPQPGAYQPERDLQTQLEVIQSRRIAGQVAETLGMGATADSILSRVSASADTGTDVISIQVIDGSAARAAETANAFATEYVAWSRSSQRESIKAAADDVETRLAQAQKQVEDAEEAASSNSASGADQVKLDSAKALYATLADKLEELRIAEQLSTGVGSVLSSASVDPSPVSPSPRRNVALGLALGLLVGLGAAYLAEALDTRIHSAEEAGAIYGTPVLATIPTEKAWRGGLPRLVTVERPGSHSAEAYRVLRNNLDFINVDRGIKTLLVTSALPSEGKSTVAANLATVLSQSGMKVMLVGCDFHRPTLERFFTLDHRAAGLSDVLQGKWELWVAAQRFGDSGGLWVLVPGTTPPNPSALLGSEAMGALIEQLRGSVDWVILDTTPVLSAADATSLVRWVDGVLLVARLGVSKRDAARASHAQLENVGARITGLVAWVPSGTDAAGGYGTYYGYATPE